MPESVQSCIELSIHLSVKRTSRELPTKNSSREKKYREMYGKFKTRLDAFWHSYIPPNQCQSGHAAGHTSFERRIVILVLLKIKILMKKRWKVRKTSRLAIFILEDALSVWTNLGKYLLFVWLFVSKDGHKKHNNGRFYTRGRIIHLDEFGQTFVVRLVIRL